MASDPTNISHACELVVGVDIEDVFHSQCGTKEIAASGVNDTLGLSS